MIDPNLFLIAIFLQMVKFSVFISPTKGEAAGEVGRGRHEQFFVLVFRHSVDLFQF